LRVIVRFETPSVHVEGVSVYGRFTKKQEHRQAFAGRCFGNVLLC
jgi:hypothetical protein